MVAGMPKLATEPWMGAMKANDEARKTGTVTRVTPWNTRVPTPAVKSATLGSSPVSSGTSTRAPKATKSIWAPVSRVRGSDSTGAAAADVEESVIVILRKNAPGARSQGRDVDGWRLSGYRRSYPRHRRGRARYSRARPGAHRRRP